MCASERYRNGRRCGGVSAVFLLLVWSAGVQATSERFSKANTLLFMTDHLASVSAPATLHYEFRRSAGDGSEFEDTIDVRIVRASDAGDKVLEIDYFTGDRRRYVPSIEAARGNPIVMIFLQRDVNEMARQTGAPWGYFQKRIRLALEKTDAVATVQITYEGKEVQAQQIALAPFLADPNRDRYRLYMGKRYLFTISAEIPGHVYQIHSIVPDEERANGEPLIEEVLTFRGLTRVPGD